MDTTPTNTTPTNTTPTNTTPTDTTSSDELREKKLILEKINILANLGYDVPGGIGIHTPLEELKLTYQIAVDVAKKQSQEIEFLLMKKLAENADPLMSLALVGAYCTSGEVGKVGELSSRVQKVFSDESLMLKLDILYNTFKQVAKQRKWTRKDFAEISKNLVQK